MEIDKIYKEDCLIGMRDIPDKSIDLIVTDPPYKLTSRGSSGTMSGYWTNDITKKGKVFENNDVEIVEMETMQDHIHIFVKSKPTYSPHFIVQQFKGYSSRILREEFAELRSRLPSLWTRSYFCESVGCISADTIIRYIENQKNN